MHRLFTVLSALFFLCSLVMAQEADSLLLADFDDDALGLNGWGAWGDACEEVQISGDPEDDDNFVLECTIDCLRPGEKKGGLSTANLHIVVDGDTATALVIHVWVEENMLAELLGLQIFCMDQVRWQWQNVWYTPTMMIADSWNRLQYNFSQSFDIIEDFATLIDSGLNVGVEFVYNDNSEYYGYIYADDIYLLGVKGETTAIEPGREVTAPAAFKLEQNYPNPFNPTTTIVYYLPQRDRVTISVYDVTGRLVRTLIENEYQPAGRVAVPLDATGLSSGIYYYRVQTSHNIQTKKMALVR